MINLSLIGPKPSCSQLAAEPAMKIKATFILLAFIDIQNIRCTEKDKGTVIYKKYSSPPLPRNCRTKQRFYR
ncbi:jg26121 [Pararge aegeria aegeria]|uniref:Jg26121 protein n=1 Tax=Pararge aegeria aegeria TaxID=348720 RepID=A0A8S4QU29_9NEOP|nr:jg26121 [Pararge aegeria aegeria]